MKEILEFLGIVVGAIFASGGFWTWVSDKRHKRTPSDDMILALGHDKIYYLCRRYLREGEIKHSEYDNLLHLYKPYKEMGGNGTAEKLMKEIENIKLVEDGS